MIRVNFREPSNSFRGSAIFLVKVLGKFQNAIYSFVFNKRFFRDNKLCIIYALIYVNYVMKMDPWCWWTGSWSIPRRMDSLWIDLCKYCVILFCV